MKASHRLLIVAAGAVAAALAAGAVASNPAELPDAEPWKAVAASGPVESAPSAEEVAWEPVRRGDRLEPRTLVRTGERGRATLTRTGDVIIVDPQSRVELPESARPGDESEVFQSSGSVVYEVDRRSGRDFKVVTPYLVAGVKGTLFMVTVTEGHASVTVEEGRVEVTSKRTGETLDVGAGESVRLDAVDDARMEHVRLRASARDQNVSKESLKLARARSRHMVRVMSRNDDVLRMDPAELDEIDPKGDAFKGGALEEEVNRLDEIDAREEELTEDLVDRQKKTSATADPTQQ